MVDLSYRDQEVDKFDKHIAMFQYRRKEVNEFDFRRLASG